MPEVVANRKENLWFADDFEERNTSPISPYIRSGVLDIGAVEWSELKKHYTREELEEFLIDEIYNGNVNLPYRECSVYDAIKSFNDLLNYTCKGPQTGKVFAKCEYKYPLSGRYFDEAIVGNVASDYFQQMNRFECSSQKFPSPVETWKDKKHLHHLVGGIFTLKYDNINMSQLRTLIQMRMYIASQFRPAVAKAIYEYFNSVDVLDFSSGWGDRLCGFYSAKTTKSYIGIDPNTKVYNNYFKQADLYKGLTTEKKVTLYNSPAEDVTLGEEIVDTVFTSPPYFNCEKYSDSDTQSYMRYSQVDSWLKGFMYPTVDMCVKALKPGGHLVINISDTKTNGKVNKICDPMNDYIASKGLIYEEGLGMKLSTRPNCDAANGDDDSELVEPVWVWRKPE